MNPIMVVTLLQSHHMDRVKAWYTRARHAAGEVTRSATKHSKKALKTTQRLRQVTADSVNQVSRTARTIRWMGYSVVAIAGVFAVGYTTNAFMNLYRTVAKKSL